MPIYAPGKRDRRNRRTISKRDVVAILQLTAMVDMFTVLVVFLLQNYASTDQILPIAETIKLPQATQVRELKPSHVVIIKDGVVSFNTKHLGSLDDFTNKEDWIFDPLKEEIIKLLNKDEVGFIVSQIKQITKEQEDPDLIEDAPLRVTIQADERVPFILVKKIMYTLTDSGIKEMNFAVAKKSEGT